MSTDTIPVEAGWRTTPPADPVDRSPRRVYGVFLGLLACVGGFVALSSWATPRPRASFVSFLAPAEHGPPTFTAADHAAVGRAVLGRSTVEEATASRTALEAKLKSLAPGRPAVVYLSAAATCDPAGRVVLLPSDVRPDTPAAGIPLREILTALASSADRKFLLLDLSWKAESIPAVVASGGVATAIAEELDAVPDAGRLVLTSCGAGQVAHIAEEFGRTAFGYYLEVGLAGWASPPGADSVTAHGLANFVRSRVQRWAELTRGVRQTPQLYGDGDDFPLVPLTGRPPAPLPEPTPTAEPSDWLRTHWASRDRLRTAGVDRLDPLAMRSLGAELLAAEAAEKAGLVTLARKQAVADAVARLVARCDRALSVKPFLAPNLVMVAPPTDAAVGAAVRAVLQLPTTKTEEVADAVKLATAKLTPLPSATAARAVVDAVSDSRLLSREAVLRANDLIAALTPRPTAVELVFLARLADMAKAAEWPWDAAVAARAWAVHRMGELVAEPTAFLALRPHLEAASTNRYRAEELLLAAGYVSPTAAESPLAVADDSYTMVRRAQSAAHAADQLLANALVYLTATIGDPDQAEAWRAAASAAKAAIVARAKLGGATGDDLGRTADILDRDTQRLALRLAPLAAPFRPDAIKQLLANAKKPDAGPATVRTIDGLLATDLPPADARAELAAARAQLVVRLGRTVLDADAADGQPAAVTKPLTSNSFEEEQAEYARAERAVTALAALADLSGRLLPTRFERSTAGRGALARDLFAAMTFDDSSLPDDRRDVWQRTLARPTDDSPAAALSLASRNEAALRGWLADWYDHLAGTAGPFFRIAAATTRPPGVVAAPVPQILISGTGELTETSPSTVRLVRVEPNTAVRVLVSANDWFSVEPAPAEKQGTPLKIALKAGSANAPPLGFLVEAAPGGRPLLARVPVPLDSVRNRLDLLFSQSPTDVVNPTARPLIRPGGLKATSYLFVRNLGDRPRTLVVELSAGSAMLKHTVSVPTSSAEAVRFPAVASPPPPAAPMAEAPIGLPELAGPMVIRVTENGREVLKREVRSEVRNPTSYAVLERAVLIPAGPTTEGKCRLEFHLRGGEGLTTPARVEVRLPDRSGPPPAGTLRGDLSAGGELRLFADLPAEPAAVEYGCHIDIDGVPRVYRFRVPAAPPPGPDLTLRQLDAAAVALTPPKTRGPRLPVLVAVDNAPSDAKLEVALGRLTAAGLEADAVLRYTAARRTRIGFTAAADGGLQFDADLRDWVAEFDAGQVRGRRVVRARVLSNVGEEVAAATIPLLLDDQAPRNVAILNLPKRAKLGAKFTIKAGGNADVAGIKEVQFFLAKSVDGKPPAGAVPIAGVPFNPDRTVWSAEITFPKEKAGPQDVSVRFVSTTGTEAFANGSLELVDYDPVKAEPGTITGTVVMGSAPQAGLEVTLTDEKGAVVKQAKTDDKGAFKFESIPPGTYAAKSSRRISGAEKVGSAPAKLPPGGRIAVRVELYIK